MAWCFSPRVSVVHYSDVTLSAMASQITGVSIVCSTENIKAPRHWPLWGESGNAENASIWWRHLAQCWVHTSTFLAVYGLTRFTLCGTTGKCLAEMTLGLSQANTVTSHECHGVSNHRKIDSLFNSLRKQRGSRRKHCSNWKVIFWLKCRWILLPWAQLTTDLSHIYIFTNWSHMRMCISNAIYTNVTVKIR